MRISIFEIQCRTVLDLTAGKYFIYTLLLAISSLMSIPAFAQGIREFKPDQYRAINWTLDDGLSLGIHCVLKDSKGFTWIGAYLGELARFDGARIEKYIPDPDKKGSILWRGINSLVEDSLHNIWIGTSGGLCRYDIVADTFTNFVTKADSANNDRGSVALWSTSNTLLALESYTRIVEYNLRTLEKKQLAYLTNQESHHITQFNSSVYDSTDHALFILEEGNGDSLHPGGGLIEISLKDGWKKHYGWSCYRHIPGDNHASEAMAFDKKRNSIWINGPDGLLEFSLGDKSFYFTDAFSELIKLKEYGRFVGIDIDRNGRIWLATHPKGVLIYDPITKTISPLFSDSSTQNKTGMNNMQVYCGRDGIVWLTYWDNRGIYELLPYQPSIALYPSNPKIKDSLDGVPYSIVPAGKEEVWLGGNDHVSIFHSALGKFEKLKLTDFPGVTGKSIAPVQVDTIRQKAWLFSYPNNWLYEMDFATRQCRKIIFRSELRQFDTLNLEANFTRNYKNGLLLYDQNHGFFELKKDSLFADLIIPFHDFVGRIVLEDDSMIFAKNPNYPYNYSFKNQNGQWKRMAHPIDSLDWVFILCQKQDHSKWISLTNKLIHYDKNAHIIKTYGKEDGFDALVFEMREDLEGNIWYVNDHKQLGQINHKTGLISIASVADGYQPQYYDWFTASGVDIQGNVYFSESVFAVGKVGLLRIDPKKYTSSDPSMVYFSSLKVNYEPFSLPTGLNSMTELNLPHDQNSISIETGIIDYYSMGKSHLRYKLEGEGKTADWQFGPAYFTIRYDNLRPGKYKLVLQASNAGNEFIGPEKILSIHISPPWWQTWWAILIFSLAFIIALQTFIQYRSRNLRQKNQELEDKVLRRTKELKLSLEELRGTQNQLIQREKMASLGELTAGIAHEIQNPLNFINNFSDLNSELIEELKSEQIKESRNYKNEEHLLDDIQKNEVKINHHGKRADAIVKGMLLHSRTSTGKKVPTDINALTDEYLRLSYHGLRAKENSFNASILTNFDPAVGELKVISQDIGRVLLNIFNNAFYSVNEKKKGMSIGYEPTISVTTKRLENKVEIRIRDNGNGIPQKILDKIYQPFFTTKPTGEGTGLGLSLSYEIIVKIHNGELKAETKEGEYAEFIIALAV